MHLNDIAVDGNECLRIMILIIIIFLSPPVSPPAASPASRVCGMEYKFYCFESHFFQ